ncbi:MAG: DJ-1/PfpI family protein [Lachnospiraceae bacterium]|nr:DJ-1/PfpI family protein [Lachnospiraceae bacterium]
MKKTAVIFANGCEEGEALTIVDILRRAELPCDIVGLTGDEITGAHNIVMKADKVFNGSLDDYDMVVLPGGYGGAAAMRDDDRLIAAIQEMNKEGKGISAICAAPIVLNKASLLEGKKFTCYPSTAKEITQGTYVNQIIVKDGNLLTSQGPATAYAFAYAIVDALGGDSLTVKNRMVYFNAFDSNVNIPSHEATIPLPEKTTDKRVAVLMVEGYEESETIQIVDMLRRMNITTHTFKFIDDEFVLSMQGMKIKADKKFSDEIKEYDVLVVPGGRTAGAKLIADESVQNMLKYFNANNKLIAGMCSGTTVLHAAGVLEGKKVTGYTGYAEKLTGANFCEDVAVYDKNVVTSQGPATPFPFAFKIMEALGVDASPLKERILYYVAGGR